MAVDTRAKRLSMLNFSAGDLLPDPSGAVDAAARATFLGLYAGIVLASPTAPGTIEGNVVLLPAVNASIELLHAVIGSTSLLPAVDGSAEILEVEV